MHSLRRRTAFGGALFCACAMVMAGATPSAAFAPGIQMPPARIAQAVKYRLAATPRPQIVNYVPPSSIRVLCGNVQALGCTKRKSGSVFISDRLSPDLKRAVLIHELAHAWYGWRH